MQIEEIPPAVVARLQIDAIRANGGHLLVQKPGLAYQYIKVQNMTDLVVHLLKLQKKPAWFCALNINEVIYIKAYKGRVQKRRSHF